MKGTAQFKEIIKNYLDNRAKEDELFRAKYETTTRTIDDVVTFILNEVQQSGMLRIFRRGSVFNWRFT